MNANTFAERKRTCWSLNAYAAGLFRIFDSSRKRRQCAHFAKTVKEHLADSFKLHLPSSIDTECLASMTSDIKNVSVVTCFGFSAPEDQEHHYRARNIAQFMSFVFSQDRDYAVGTLSQFDFPVVQFCVTYKNELTFRIMLCESSLTDTRKTFCLYVVVI